MIRNFISPDNSIPSSYAWASLPSASTVSPRQLYFVSDIGPNGSYWFSNGTTWSPANGPISLVVGSYPFIVPSSGSVAVTTGAITLTTALDKTYSAAYMYFPAGAFTGSVAGFYYVTMTNATSGIMYSNKYVSGIPSTPASPTLVTTGVGAYTQDTGVVDATKYTIPANALNTSGKIYYEAMGPRHNSASGAAFQVLFGGSALGAVLPTFSVSASSYQGYITNQNAANVQTYIAKNFLSGGSNVGSLAVNTAADVIVTTQMQIALATDWLVCSWVTINLQR